MQTVCESGCLNLYPIADDESYSKGTIAFTFAQKEQLAPPREIRFGMSCRTYLDGSLRSGIPSRELLCRAITESMTHVPVSFATEPNASTAGTLLNSQSSPISGSNDSIGASGSTGWGFSLSDLWESPDGTWFKRPTAARNGCRIVAVCEVKRKSR